MHRELLSNPHIASYSTFLLLAFLSGYLLARRHSSRIGIQGRHIDNQCLIIVVVSLVGARVFSWLFYFPSGFSLWEALLMPGGGLVFYGGLAFGIASVIVYSWVARLPLKDLSDLWSAPAALGLAVGRVGCFLAGCCWGDLCVPPEQMQPVSDSVTRWQIYSVPQLSTRHFPLAVQFPASTGAHEQHQKLGLIDPRAAASLPVHPVQLYEAMAVFALSIALHRCFLRRRTRGSVFARLAIGYGVIRFFVEFLRADNPPIYAGLTLSQVISLSFIAGGTLLVLRFHERAPKSLIGPCGVESHL
jgi:phosphatidylglycerol:prolipoprotein diacylglycerol transferase